MLCKRKDEMAQAQILPGLSYKAGFLPGIFSGGISCYANFFCCDNFSIVFGLNLKQPRGVGRPLPPCGKKREGAFYPNAKIFRI